MLTAWRVEALVNYFQVVAVEIGNVGCVVARAEVRAYRWLALARSAGLNPCSVRGVDLGLVVSNKPYIQSGSPDWRRRSQILEPTATPEP